MKKLLLGIFGVAALLYAGDVAVACFIRSPLPVQVWADHIEIEIRDQVAIKKYDCKFLNPNPQAVVGGECYMEVEPGAQVDNMSLTIDGKEVEAELLSKSKANEVFQDIVKKGGSPALLEFYGNQLIRSKVPRIAPNGTVTVKLQYTTVLHAKGGLVRMQFLNTNPKAMLKPLKHASVRINIHSKTPIKNVYSPSHPIKIVETDEADVRVEWEQNNYLPRMPFVFYYALSDQPVGANLLAYREEGEDGYFMLMVSPTVGNTTQIRNAPTVAPKDVVFCVDTSGSMVHNGQIDQMKKALEHSIGALHSGDRFNIVSFATDARVMSRDGLLHADESSRARAIRYVDGLRARGGTAIEDAMELALGQFDERPRMKMIFFVTDGQPSIGETDVDKLLKGVEDRNRKDVRIFVFGVGTDVNARLLDSLAGDNRGDSEYILPTEAIASKIGPYFDRVGSPILSDVRVEITGTEVTQVYPRGRTDLFKGSQIILFGRYKGAGPADVTLIGSVNGEERSFSYGIEFPAGETKNDFVPRLWAGRKVNFLLSQLRRNGESKELIDEVVDLSKRFGIVTPYTSFLVVQDDPAIPTGGGGWGGARPLPAPATIKSGLMRKLGDQAREEKANSEEPEARLEYAKKAKRFSQGQKNYRADDWDRQADEELRAAGKEGSSMTVMRNIGSRTFYNVRGQWYESVFDAERDKTLQVVKIGSEDYAKLIEGNEGLAKYLSLGEVTVQYKGQWYQARR